MSVRDAVVEALAGHEGWQVEVALALAADVDKRGTAAAAKELRALMAELGAGGSASKPGKETGLSEFEKRLQAKQSAPKAARRTGSG